jgi:hypothetical protein
MGCFCFVSSFLCAPLCLSDFVAAPSICYYKPVLPSIGTIHLLCPLRRETIYIINLNVFKCATFDFPSVSNK